MWNNFTKFKCFRYFKDLLTIRRQSYCVFSVILLFCANPTFVFAEDESYTIKTQVLGSLISELKGDVEVEIEGLVNEEGKEVSIFRTEKHQMPITGFSISLDDTYFTFEQGSNIGFVSTPISLRPRESKGLNIKGMFAFKNLIGSSFMQSDEENLNLFFGISSDGYLDIYSANSFKGKNINEKSKRQYLSSFSNLKNPEEYSVFFCNDGQRFVIADGEGNVYYYNYDRLENKYRMNLISSKNQTSVLHVDFSEDGKKILIFYADSSIHIISTDDLSEIYKLHNTQVNISKIKFCPDSEHLAFCPDQKTVVVTDMEGNVTDFIPVNVNIKDIDFVFDGNFLVVISESDDVYFFSAVDFSYIGIITAARDEEKMTAWAFSTYGNYMLQGFANGEVRKLELLILDSHGLLVYGGNISATNSKIIPVYENGFCISAFGLFGTHPYAGGAKIGGEISFGKNIAPFYLGIEFDGLLEFPHPDFPYVYYAEGVQMRSPYCISMGLYAPIGVQLKFNGTPIKVGAELDFGARMILLYGRTEMLSVNSTIAYSIPYVAFDLGGFVFASINDIRLTAGITWDYTIGFIPQIGIGYNFVFKDG